MKSFKRILVIHPNRANAKLLRNGFESQGQKVKSIYAGMDSVPAFEQFRPEAVVVDEALMDLPVEAVVAAFRQMDPDVYIFLAGLADTTELRLKCRNLAVTGCIIPPFGKVNWVKAMEMVVSSEGQADDGLGDVTRSAYMDSHDWEEFPHLAEHETIEAKHLAKGSSHHFPGSLKIEGNVRHVENLVVGGSLLVDGSLVDSKVRVGRNLSVKGQIENCKHGVFAKGDVEVESIRGSLLVAGGNLIIVKSCRNSNVTVLQRMIGRTPKSKIVGGRTRVGEHLSMAVLGDHNHSLTRIHLAPANMHDAWVLHKRRIWKFLCGQVPEVPAKRKALFEKQIANPKFFQLLGEIFADKLYPGVDLSIGGKEDIVFEIHDRPSRIALGKKNRHAFGICIRKRQARKTEGGPQRITANLD